MQGSSPTSILSSAGVSWHGEAGFHLRHGLARTKPLEGEVPAFGPFENVDLVDGSAQHVLAIVARELEEALVHLDEAQVRETADRGRRRIGRKRPLEAVLGLDPIADVVNDENQTVGNTGLIGDHQAANAVGAVPVLIGSVSHHDLDIFEGLAGNNTVDRIATMVEQMGALMPQDEVLAVVVDRVTELVEARHPVHLQRGLVGVGDGLVRFDQDHALRQAGDDLLQLRAIRNIGRSTLAARAPGINASYARICLCHGTATLRFLSPRLNETRRGWFHAVRRTHPIATIPMAAPLPSLTMTTRVPGSSVSRVRKAASTAL
jgi:hypothetical protein